MSVAEMRKQNNMSQKELAEKIGIDQSMLSRIERGEREIDGELQVKLDAVFNNNIKEKQYNIKNNKEERNKIALTILSGMAAGIDVYGSSRPGYFNRLVQSAFDLADEFIAYDK